MYYFYHGFQVTVIMSENEHKPYIERRICVVKERIRLIVHSLLFTLYPHQLTVYMIFYVMKLLNYFP